MSLFERLAAALSLAAPADMLPGDIHEVVNGERLRQAAVLVAITDRAEPGLILTERHADLRLHGGQVAFPGGRIDEGENAREAALREAWEEIALDPAEVRIVAVIPPDLDLTPNPIEVEAVFEAPLAHLLDPANQLRKSGHFRGRERHYFEIVWDDRRVWGATAAMIVNLSRRLKWS